MLQWYLTRRKYEMNDARYNKYRIILMWVIIATVALIVSLISAFVLALVVVPSNVFLHMFIVVSMICILGLIPIPIITCVMNNNDRIEDISLHRNPNRTYFIFKVSGNKEQCIKEIDALLRDNNYKAELYGNEEIIYKKYNFVLSPFSCIKLYYEDDYLYIETFLYYPKGLFKNKEITLYSVLGNDFIQLAMMKLIKRINDVLLTKGN